MSGRRSPVLLLRRLLAAELETSEAADDDVFTDLGDVLLDQIADRTPAVLDEGLIEQGDGLERLGSATEIGFQLRPGVVRDLALVDKAGIGAGRNLHGDVV